jgi:predicted nuclease with TOPRIM domain
LARGQSELVKGQLEMAADITEIKEKMHILEEDVDGTKKQIKDITIECSKRDKVLKDLKTKVEALQPDSIIEIRKEMKELSPLLKKSVKVNSIWNIALRIVAGIILGISLVWLLLKYTWNLL